MNEYLLNKIRNNKTVYSLLREESYHYKYLYRDSSYFQEIEKRSKEKYHERIEDKLEDIQNKMNLVETFLGIIK